MSIETPEHTERSELLRQLRITRDGHPRRSAVRPLAIAAVVLLAVAGVVWLVFGGLAAPTVRTVIAQAAGASGGSASILDASGYVTARRQATVSAKVTGKITAVLIEEGMRVKEGDVLARLDDAEARAQLALSQAQLTAARSQLAEIRALLAQAERDHARQTELARRQLVSEQSVDASLAQRDMLRARLGAATENVRVATESVRVAEVQLDNTVIRAPFGGIVVAKTAQPGEMISPISAGAGFTRTGVGTIVDMDSLEVQVDVNEAFIGRVSPGQRVEATLNAYPDWKIPASVIAIIPSADRSKATVKVRIAIDSKDSRIVPDMGVRVGFLAADGAPREAAAPAGVLLPADAIRGEGTGGVVFVYAAGKVERRAVTLGPAAGSSRLVLSGVREGEHVVVSPPASLRDGERVKLAEKS